MHLNNKVYDVLKWIVAIALPAISAAYFALAGIYGWSNAEQVVGTIAVVTTLLGTLMGLSTASYNKSGFDGDMVVNKSDASEVFRFELNTPPETLSGQKTVKFNVKQKELPQDYSQ